MPGILEIGEQLVGFTAEERNELFPQFLREAWQAPGVSSTFYYAILAFILSGAAYFYLQRNTPATIRDSFYTGKLTTAVFLIIATIAITWFTFSEIQLAYAEALEEGESLAIWAQMVTISAGFVLLLLSWLVWRTAAHRDSNLQTGLRFLAGILLMIGGWVLISELPVIIAEGDSDWWIGLRTTIFYVVGALPAELFLGLVLATLLFQDIKAKGLLRMIYFLPYITPAVGAAAVFKVLFSGNPSGTVNTLLASLGFQSLGWLNEPNGINQLIGDTLNLNVPNWAEGPSLALVVAIIFGIWKYTGYNVVFFLAGLGNISREYYEAASMDGAGRWAQFRHITLPLLSPITYFLTIFGVIGAFKAFNTIFVLRTRAALGTMDTASLVIFDAFNRDTRIGYAAALGIILLLVILSATALLDRLAKGRVFYG
jgi:multiple sugar transport system permease protein